MSDELKIYKAEFPHGEHDDCRALTALTIDHLPPDGSLGKPLKFGRGADIWQPGDRSDKIFFVKGGQVALIASSIEGTEVVLNVFEAGEPFGELCFCGGEDAHRHNSARATTDSVIAEIKLGDFSAYLQDNVGILCAFIFTFCIRLTDAQRRIEILSYRGADERLGMLLLHLANTHEKRSIEEKTGEARLLVTHDELARMAAMSRQHVTITLGRLRRAGIVSYKRGQPLVVKSDALIEYLTDKSFKR
ncbi:MAG: Crp/Fnr family transcriptional regulator [Acidobacteriota bacterium]|nr:Crp/Fnr family transcriptional regulator [Acidobacteriota bacterium]